MTRDYARKTVARKRASQRRSWIKLWGTVLLLFILFTAGLVLWGKYREKIVIGAKGKISTKVSPTNVTRKIKPEPSKEVATPKFDFYTILPQERGETLRVAYEIVIATVSTYAAADQRKAELALLGFTASITPLRVKGVQKYQVILGPYDNREGAVTDLTALKQHKLTGRLRRLR